MTLQQRARIVGTGMYVPPDVYTNHDLAKLMDTSDEWIQQRSGIRERRFAKPGVGTSDLALEAARHALTAAGLKSSDLDLIIFATLSPDYYFPGAGVFLQDKLGCGTIPAFDIRNQCSGFLYGLNTAQAFIASGQYKRVLLVGAEVQSHALNLTTPGRDVSVLFGDGAGAVVLVPSSDKDQGILSVHLHSEGAHRDLLKIHYPSSSQVPMVSKEILDEGGQYPYMDGRNVFKHAVTRLPEVVHEALSHNNLKPDDVGLYLFHQANMRINEAVLKHLGQSVSKSHNNIERFGNCSAASIPMCLDEAVRGDRLKSGDIVCMGAFGAGFTWGSAVIRW
jgi:3-oxoacyl-[acyl-carrier-protein] synthase-3